MSWTSITVADLKDTKIADLVTACQEAGLGAEQTDPLLRIIANVVARIRAEVASCSANSLDADTTTIPADLKSLACRMIVREGMSRLQLDLNEDEREEQRNDLRYLERISEGKVKVAETDNPLTTEEVQATSGTPRLTARPRRFGREHEDGI